MRKTKIICTLGPSTDKGDVLRDLIANGMNVARFNFSHGSYEEHGGRLAKLKALREELGKPVAALLDTKGPEIRLKEFKNGVEMLEAGQTFHPRSGGHQGDLLRHLQGSAPGCAARRHHHAGRRPDHAAH